MGVDNFKVTFDKPDCTYFNGDKITVRVDITSLSGFKLNEISCKLHGEATTEWNHEYNFLSRRTVVCEGREVYFDEKHILFRKPHAQPVEFPPGEYNYQFTFEIPHGLPPSYFKFNIFPLGKAIVQYDVTVIMDRPFHLDKTINKRFFIQSLFDLNQYPALLEPAGTIMENNLWACISTGNIEAVIRIPYKGYVVGQNIPITIQIENDSNLDIKDIGIQMRRCNTIYAVRGTYSKKIFETVKHQQSLGVKVKAGHNYAFCFNYEVPDVPVVNMAHCAIIDVKYILKFELKLSGLSRNMTGQLPFLVGNVPFGNAQLPNEPLPYNLIEISK